jgi:uncharacterized GH25 family protein
MRTNRSSARPWTIALFFFLALGLGLPAAAQSKTKDPGKDKKSEDISISLTIRVVGGPKSKPVANASVYLRFKEKQALLFLLHKKKKVELDLKTDNNGVASFSGLPQGKVLIQVVAPQWQTFGEYYDLQQEKRTILIKLHKPKTHWY